MPNRPSISAACDVKTQSFMEIICLNYERCETTQKGFHEDRKWTKWERLKVH